MQQFKVIDGGKAEIISQVTCSQCEQDIGVATSHFVESKIAPLKHKGRATAGKKALLCIHCLIRGKVTAY